MSRLQQKKIGDKSIREDLPTREEIKALRKTIPTRTFKQGVGSLFRNKPKKN